MGSVSFSVRAVSARGVLLRVCVFDAHIPTAIYYTIYITTYITRGNGDFLDIVLSWYR